MSKSISLFSALLCTFIWGTTFIAQDTGMDNIGPFTFNSVRFFVGFLAILPLVLLFELKKFKSELNLDKKISLIDKFIKNSPKIDINKEYETSNHIIVESNIKDDLVTETLAKIYTEQGKYNKAEKAYKILSLKYPKKSIFFADQIKRIRNLKNNS